MIERNHEAYVSLEIAKLLKEAGFDWTIDCDFVYAIFNDRTEFLNNIYVINTYQSNIRPGLGPLDRDSYICKYHAPTLEVAQRWLREVKGHSIYPTYGGYKIYVLDANDSAGFSRTYGLNSNLTYEEAQEAGIKKALEMILEKGE